MKVYLENILGNNPISELDNTNASVQHYFITEFKRIWAINADAISMHYAGTGSVISSVTKVGKKNFLGFIDHGMKTLTRFYNSNFEDQIKQECIDLLLGQHTETVSGKSRNLIYFKLV